MLRTKTSNKVYIDFDIDAFQKWVGSQKFFSLLEETFQFNHERTGMG